MRFVQNTVITIETRVLQAFCSTIGCVERDTLFSLAVTITTADGTLNLGWHSSTFQQRPGTSLCDKAHVTVRTLLNTDTQHRYGITGCIVCNAVTPVTNNSDPWLCTRMPYVPKYHLTCADAVPLAVALRPGLDTMTFLQSSLFVYRSNPRLLINNTPL